MSAGKARAPLLFEAPKVFSVLEDFNHNPGSNLAGTSANPGPGGAWTGSGATDFGLGSGGYLAAVRTFTGDAVGAGRYAWLATSITGAVYGQVAFAIDNWSLAGRYGAMIRVTDQNNWLRVSANPVPVGGTIEVHKRTGGGTPVLLGSIPSPVGLFNGVWYVFRPLALADGRWAVWFFALNTVPGNPVMQDYDLSLETGQTLANGKIGLYDEHSSGQTCGRSYASLFASIPTADAALFSGRSASFKHDIALRDNSGGTAQGKVPQFRGKYPSAPPATRAARTSRLVVKARRFDIDSGLASRGVSDNLRLDVAAQGRVTLLSK
jgi:hypothetical protein